MFFDETAEALTSFKDEGILILRAESFQCLTSVASIAVGSLIVAALREADELLHVMNIRVAIRLLLLPSDEEHCSNKSAGNNCSETSRTGKSLRFRKSFHGKL